MGLGIVVRLVPERRVDAALGRAGVAPRRVQLRHDRNPSACVVGLDRGAHACAAGAHNQHVERPVHLHGNYRMPPLAGSGPVRARRYATTASGPSRVRLLEERELEAGRRLEPCVP